MSLSLFLYVVTVKKNYNMPVNIELFFFTLVFYIV